MTNRFIRRFTVLVGTILLAASAVAQAKPPAQDTGLTSYVEFGGTTNSAGQVYELDSSIGYTFTEHFGMDLGVPVYFVNTSSSTTGATSGRGVGVAAVNDVVKELGGVLSVSSREGAGTCWRLTFPVGAPDPIRDGHDQHVSAPAAAAAR